MAENQLPKGWVGLNMGESFLIERGGSPRPIKDFITDEEDGVNWIKIGDTKNSSKYIYTTNEKIKPEGISKSRMVYEDDFILSNSMSFGRPYIMKTEGCIHDGWLVIRKNKNVNSDYLYYVLSSDFCYQQFQKLAKGSTVKNLNIQAVQKVNFPLPPLAEQQRIVAKLDKLFAHLEETKTRLNKIPQLLKNFRQSVLTQAVTGKLTEDWRKENGLKNWEELTLGEFAKIVRGGSPRPAGDPRFYGGKYPFIKVKDITKDKEIYLQSYENTVTELGLNKTRLIPAETVILSNSGATLGVPKIAPYEITANDGVAAFLDLKNCLPKYLYYFLTSQTKAFRALKIGAAQPNLNTDIIRNWKISLPTKEEQELIVLQTERSLTKIANIEANYFLLKAKIENLPQSILAKAFKGELVEQLPTDGDAQELLDEIKKLKAQTTKKKKK